MPYVAIEDNFPGYPKIRMATFAMCESPPPDHDLGCLFAHVLLLFRLGSDMGLVPGALFWGMTADVIGRRYVDRTTAVRDPC